MASEPDSFRVSQSTGGLPLMDAPVVDNKAPAQLEAMGQAVTRTGAAAGAIYTDVLQRANQARVDEQLNKLKEAQLDATFGENGYLRHKGRDALFRPDGKSLTEEYGSTFDTARDTLASELTNDAQREAFTRSAGGMSIQFRGQVDQHSEQQFGVYNQSVLEGTLTNRSREIALSNDPEVINNAILSTRSAVFELGNLTGRNSGEQIDADTRVALTPGLLANATRLLDSNDVSAAEKFIDRYREYFTPDGLLKLDMAIGEAQDVQIVNAELNSAFAAQTSVEVAATPQPLIMPVRGDIGGAFWTQRPTHKHAGIDINVRAGTPVSAPAAGRIRYEDDLKGYGYYIEIDHGGGMTTRVAHLSQRGHEGLAEDGSYVSQGQIIGLSGGVPGTAGAGNSKGAHVHYEVRKNGKPVDPTGKHSTPGGAVGGSSGGKPKTRYELMQAGRANPLIANDPQRLAMWDNQVTTLVAARDQARAQEEEDAVDAGYNAILAAKGDISKVSPSVLASIPGRAKPGLLNFAQDLQRPADNQTADLGVYGAVRAGIQSGEITRPEQIFPFAPKLGPSLTKALIDDVTGTKKGDARTLDSLKTTKDVMGWIGPELKNAGLDEKENPKEFTVFRGKLFDQIRRAERAKGGALTGVEANEIAVSMLAETKKDAPGWFSGNLRGYQIDDPVVSYRAIPLPVREQIEEGLIRKGVKPTQTAVRNEYYIWTERQRKLAGER